MPLEAETIELGQGLAFAPEFVGRGSPRAPGSSGLIGLESSGLAVIGGPVARASLPRRLIVCPSFQRAITGFAGAIVPGHADGGEERSHVFGVEESEYFFGPEGRTVISLQDEWCAVFMEECGERISSGSGIGMDTGEPGELAAGGDVTDGEEMGELSFDGRGGIAEVHGPDGARAMPMEDMGEELVIAEVNAAEAAEEIGEFLARHFREEPMESGESHGGAEVAEDVDDVVAEQA